MATKKTPGETLDASESQVKAATETGGVNGAVQSPEPPVGGGKVQGGTDDSKFDGKAAILALQRNLEYVAGQLNIQLPG